MNERTITPDLRMADITNTWPMTIPVFLKYRMICVGCYMSSFDTLEDALKIYGLPVEQVLDELNLVIQTDHVEDEE